VHITRLDTRCEHWNQTVYCGRCQRPRNGFIMTDDRNNIVLDFSDGDDGDYDYDGHNDDQVYGGVTYNGIYYNFFELEWNSERFEDSPTEENRVVAQRCAILERNDDHVTQLDMLHDCCVDNSSYEVKLRHGEYAYQLGDAIEGNTSVSRVLMDIHIYRGEDDWSEDESDNKTARDNAAPMLKFLEKGSALTSVVLSDCLGEDRENEAISKEWGDLFCESIAKNRKLTNLRIKYGIRVSPTMFAKMLQTATSLETLEFYLENLGSNLASEATAWAQAIAEHAVLNTMCVHVSDATNTMACTLLSLPRVHG
jgi:hypothetical protein